MFSEKSKNLLKIINDHGYEAYLVGGCVRDMLMSAEIHDYDVCTSARPEEVKEIFKGYRVIETGIKHGTVTVLFEGNPFEITTYRCDGEYKDGRHPDMVSFSGDLKEDLSRRDFTMNAIAWSETGTVDIFEGKKDIDRSLIRCVGDADKRFKEDALRILRALRFASVLGFEIEENTERAAFENKELIKKVSSERIFSEFCKLLCGKNAPKVIRKYIDIIAVFIPELLPCKGFDQKTEYHKYDVLEHSIKALEYAEADKSIRIAALLHDIGKPLCFTLDEKGRGHFYGHPEISARMATDILKRLKADRALTDKVELLVRYHDTPTKKDRAFVKRLLNTVGEENFFDFIKVYYADGAAHAEGHRDSAERAMWMKNEAEDIISRKECYRREDLHINGNDLISLGLRGKAVREAIDTVLDEIISGKLENERTVLLERISKYIKTGKEDS